MRVAIVGTGTGHEKAPYNDPSYQIWSIPGIYATASRVDRIYEIHSPEVLSGIPTPKDKWEWMVKHISVCHPGTASTFKGARPIDFEGLMEKFGRFFTSSVSWMLAEAINEGATEISLYGVTMSSKDEYAHQKPSCAYLIGWAKALGIKVNLQKSSELMSTVFVYGYEDKPDLLVGLEDRKRMADGNMVKAEEDYMEARARYHKSEGYKEAIEYMEDNLWSHTRNK